MTHPDFFIGAQSVPDCSPRLKRGIAFPSGKITRGQKKGPWAAPRVNNLGRISDFPEELFTEGL